MTETISPETEVQNAGRPDARERFSVKRILTHRRLPWMLAGLAVVLAGPSLWGGWVGDDDHHRLRFLGSEDLPDLSGEPFKLFVFADGDPARTRRLVDIGVWPWWTMPDLRAAFWRPLTVVTHWLDYQLWPNQAWLMHAHSLAWFAALAAAVTVLYRRFHTGTAGVLAGLAALLYVIDDARGMPVGFIANRNAIIAAVFGVLALIAHDRWRREGRRWFALWALVCFVASLLSAEAGVGAGAFLLSYTVFLDRGNWRQRAAALAPYLIVGLFWRLAWSALGYGIYGVGLYVDPATEPVRFLIGVANRLPVLLLGQLLFPPSEIYLLAMASGLRYYFVAAAVVLVVLLGAIMLRRIALDATMRFWLFGMLLAVLPICATFPSDRLLFFVGLGAAPLIACFLLRVFGRVDRVDGTPCPSRDVDLESGGRASPEDSGEVDELPNRGRARPKRGTGRLAKVTGILLIVIHVGIAPLVLAARAGVPIAPRSLVESAKVHLPPETLVENRTVVIVSAPVPIFAGLLAEQRALAGLPVPGRTRVLAPNDKEYVRVHRPDAHTLCVRPARGYLRLPLDRLARSRHHPMSLGQRVELPGMTAEVMAMTDDGRPLEVAFRFDVPLEDPSLIWLQWKDKHFQAFTPPAIGEAVELRPGRGWM